MKRGLINRFALVTETFLKLTIIIFHGNFVGYGLKELSLQVNFVADLTIFFYILLNIF